MLGCTVCQVEKRQSFQTSGKLLPLEVPIRKWDHVVLDFVLGLPVHQGIDTICMVVDKATKMCHFLPCSESIPAKQVAKLYWQHVEKYMESPVY